MKYIKEYENSMKVAGDKFDISMEKVGMFTEGCLKEYSLFLEEAQNKVITESGTIDDLQYYCEEATEGLVGRISESIKAIIKAFKDFCSEIKEKIMAAISKKETNKAIDDVEKRVKMNPFLARKKISYVDTESEIKVCDKYLDSVRKFIAKLKHGAGSKEELNNIEDKYDADLAKVVRTSVITTTIIGALAALKKVKNDIGSRSMKSEKETSEIFEAAISGLDADGKELSLEAYNAAAKFAAKVGKRKQSAIMNTFSNIWYSIKNAVRELKGNTPNNIFESGSDEELDVDAYTKEYMESLTDEVFGESVQSEESDPLADTSAWLNTLLD